MKNNTGLIIVLLAAGVFAFYQFKKPKEGSPSSQTTSSERALPQSNQAPQTTQNPSSPPESPSASAPSARAAISGKQDSVINSYVAEDRKKIEAIKAEKLQGLSDSDVAKMKEAEEAHLKEAEKIKHDDQEKFEKRRAEAIEEEKKLRESQGNKVIKF